MKAHSIDEVLSLLDGITADAEKYGKRVGYFACLYRKVTQKVKEGIAKGIFQDGLRMERLDVAFANRFFEALDGWQTPGQRPSDSWKTAFEAAERRRPLILQHLMLGINAHINLDLGIAAVEVMKGQDLDGIHEDFNTINEVIGSLTYEVFHEIDRMSPLMSFLGFHANRRNTFLVQFSVGNARDGAWCFAESLSEKNGAAYDSCMAARDKDIAKLGATLVNNRGLLKLTLGVIRLFEWKSPVRIIQELKSYTREYLHADAVAGKD